jgi:hypothetical protein
MPNGHDPNKTPPPPPPPPPPGGGAKPGHTGTITPDGGSDLPPQTRRLLRKAAAIGGGLGGLVGGLIGALIGCCLCMQHMHYPH